LYVGKVWRVEVGGGDGGEGCVGERVLLWGRRWLRGGGEGGREERWKGREGKKGVIEYRACFKLMSRKVDGRLHVRGHGRAISNLYYVSSVTGHSVRFQDSL